MWLRLHPSNRAASETVISLRSTLPRTRILAASVSGSVVAIGSTVVPRFIDPYHLDPLSRTVSAGKGCRLAVAVGAEEAKVLGPAVPELTIDVINLESKDVRSRCRQPRHGGNVSTGSDENRAQHGGRRADHAA
jgi:hypothetical protein